MTTADAKAYLAKREIPQLFESLMTGLMYYRPEDHITYLQDCLLKVKDQGVDTVRWNLFIEQRRRTPLPPISGGNGRTPTPGLDRDTSFVAETFQLDSSRSLDDKGVPLPPIAGDRIRQTDRQTSRDRDNNRQHGTRVGGRSSPRAEPSAPPAADRRVKGMPTCPIVLVMGGPGSGRATQCERLIGRYEGWIHLSIGDLLRDKVFKSGSADDKWDAVGALIKNGEMAPEEVTIELLQESLQSHMSASGIILEGFPRNMQQVEELNSVIGQVDLAFVLDCEENYLQQRLLSRGQITERLDDNMKAIANRITFFKEHTLPVIKHFDDEGKVVIIDGDRDTDVIFYDLSLLFDHTFYSGYGGEGVSGQGTTPRPPSVPKPHSPRPGSTRYSRPGSRSSRPGSGFTNVARSLDLDTTDRGRQDDMPSCPVMIVLGGPGINRKDIAKKLSEKHEGAVLISMGELLGSAGNNGRLVPDADAIRALMDVIKSNKDVKGIVIEGFPRNKVQMEALYSELGGINAVVLLDCERDFMEKQLANRGIDKEEIERRISHFKYNTLPIVAHFDDQRKLVVVNAEQDEASLLFEVKTGLESVVHGTPREMSTVSPIPSPRAESPKLSPRAGSSKHSSRAGSPKRSPRAESPKHSPRADSTPPSPRNKDAPAIERIVISVVDAGRQPGGPQCCLIAVVGAPGSGVDAQCTRLVEKFPGFVLVKDLAAAQDNTDAKGIIFENYPIIKTDIEQFNEKLGGMDCVVVLDCDEEYAKQNAGSQQTELESYKQDTLPALAHYEEQNKLEYVNIQRESSDDVFVDLCKVVEKALQSHLIGNTMNVTRLEVETADTGRKEGLPLVPIIAVIGNTGDYCSKVPESMPGVVHLKCEVIGDLISSMKSSTDAKGFILENFPADKDQFEEFNKSVGGMTGVIMMDASMEYLKEKGVDEDKIQNMAEKTFPVIAHYEDVGKLEYINTETDESTISESLSKALEIIVKASM